MSRYDTALSATFGVPPTPKQQVVQYPSNPPSTTPTPDAEDDDEFDDISSNIEELLTKASDAVESLSDIAKAEESPRAFEVLNTMLTTMAALNMQLIEVQERKAKLKKLRSEVGEATSQQSPQTINNNVVFVGTTQELQQMIRQRLNGNQT